MKITQYCVVLKEDAIFKDDIADKIRNMTLKTYELRFPFAELIEVYFCGALEECKNFIHKLDEDIKFLFYIKEKKS